MNWDVKASQIETIRERYHSKHWPVACRDTIASQLPTGAAKCKLHS